jgi:hypothetical protein
MTTMETPDVNGTARAVIGKIPSVAVDGAEPRKSARQLVNKHLAHHGPKEEA